jgi:hypothetical protein
MCLDDPLDLLLDRLHVETGAFLHRRELDRGAAGLGIIISKWQYLFNVLVEQALRHVKNVAPQTTSQFLMARIRRSCRILRCSEAPFSPGARSKTTLPILPVKANGALALYVGETTSPLSLPMSIPE